MAAPLLDHHDHPTTSTPSAASGIAQPDNSRPGLTLPAWRPVLLVVAFAVAAVVVLGLSLTVPVNLGTASVRVYRVDSQGTDGHWEPWAWGLDAPAHPAARAQTDKRDCQRRAPTHTCRIGTAARFRTDRDARSYRQKACRTHTSATGQLPAGMTTCD